MFTKPKTKKVCRTTPIAIESKLKPLPNIGNASKVTCAGTCKNRNSTTVSKPCSRSTDRTGRSGSVTERDTRPRVGKVLHTLNKKPRDSIKYTTYGRSSDPSYEDPARRSLLPDPYADLKSNLDGGVPLDPNAPWWLFLAEMKLQARRQAVNLDSKSETQHVRQEEKIDVSADSKQDSNKARKLDCKIEKQSDEENAHGRNNSKSEDFKSSTDNDESSASKTIEHKAKGNNSQEDDKGNEDTAGQDDNDNDDEEDEEEDEMGLPQAVRALQSKPVSLNAREVVKERHRVMMEEIARTVRAQKLMTHLKTQGFFNYDYSPHARTNMTNHNLRKGKKRGMERLLLLLACRPAKCTGELFGIV